MSLVAELRRRNVFRVAAAYLVVGWLLTEVLTTILPTLGAPDWTSRAVILIFAFGFFPAVIFSWFFELTTEGIKREDELGDGEREKTRFGKTLDYVTVVGVVVLIVFVGLFSAQQADEDVPPIAGDPAPVVAASVAVLPFVNMSNDDDNEYFSDGLTETLLHMLAQIPDLKVAARTSSFAFKGQNVSVREIATALKVAHILEGSVQRVGDRVRITAQLIRASDGFHVWSSNYDRTLDDIFGIQDEIAQKVGFALSESLLGAGGSTLAGVQTSSPDAYDLYLQARKERATYSYGGLKAAEDLLKGALLIDPDFVEAKTELATSYLNQAETGLMDPQDAYTEILAITQQVLATHPDDVVAKAARVYVEAIQEAMSGNVALLQESIGVLEGMVEASPDELHIGMMLVRAYKGLGQGEQSVPVLEAALQRDPFNPQILYELGSLYRILRRWDEAQAMLEKSLEIEPDQPNAYSVLAEINLTSGDGVGYVQGFLKALEIDPRDHELPGLLAEFLYNLELFEEGDDLRDRVMTIAPTSEIAFRLELLRAMRMGDEGAADASARRAIEAKIDNRRYAFGGAVEYLLRAAIRNETVAEEMAYLDREEPGIFDFENPEMPSRYRNAMGPAFDAWYATLPREELLRRIDLLLERGEKNGMKLHDNPYAQMNVLAMRGEVEKAIEVALADVFTQSVTTNFNWRNMFEQAQFRELVADPRIQAAMQRWEDEESVLRGEVQTYLADLHAAI
jgi:TolB-like protein/tetratricopeptide (TPR) repeat protein